MSNINDSRQGKKVGIITIILIILMVLITVYEFVSCLNGGGDSWRFDHF